MCTWLMIGDMTEVFWVHVALKGFVLMLRIYTWLLHAFIIMLLTAQAALGALP